MATKYMRAPDWFRKGDGLFAVEGGLTTAIAEPTRRRRGQTQPYSPSFVTDANGTSSANFGQIDTLSTERQIGLALKLSF
jgi:hypothetical protein